MRISDWSSDVCSSDLVPQQNCSVLINTYTNHPGILRHGAQKSADASAFGEMLINDGIANEAQSGCHMEIAYAVRFPARSLYQHCFAHHRCTGGGAGDQAAASVNVPKHSFDRRISRSEEHTSELQSLMRISYAVFCLKKKTQIINSV